jgi:hypothetical protein
MNTRNAGAVFVMLHCTKQRVDDASRGLTSFRPLRRKGFEREDGEVTIQRGVVTKSNGVELMRLISLNV